jgi:hypothetical protein
LISAGYEWNKEGINSWLSISLTNKLAIEIGGEMIMGCDAERGAALTVASEESLVGVFVALGWSIFDPIDFWANQIIELWVKGRRQESAYAVGVNYPGGSERRLSYDNCFSLDWDKEQ